MRPALAALLCAALAVPACVRDGGGSGTGPEIEVVTALYPLTFVAERVGGAGVSVEDVAPPGAEPHDIELTSAQVGRIEQADVVLLIKGLQPALDDAAKAGNTFDARYVTGGIDPHVWLDPVLLTQIANALAERLGSIDKDNADGYRANAAALGRELEVLHDATTAALDSCERQDVVTGHAAFGRFAARYGLTQRGIGGVDPEAEPTPRQIADAVAYAKARGVTTVFAESANDKAAQTVAREAGAEVAVLDPVEVDHGDGYVAVMTRNVTTLRTALGCT